MRRGCWGPPSSSHATFSLGNICYVHVPKFHPQVVIFIQEYSLLPGLTQSHGLIPREPGQIRRRGGGFKLAKEGMEGMLLDLSPVCVLFNVQKVVCHGLECELMQ